MVTLPERYNVSTLIDANLEAGRAGKVAIYCGDQKITYAELYGRVCGMARVLRDSGVGWEQNQYSIHGASTNEILNQGFPRRRSTDDKLFNILQDRIR